MEWYIVLPIIFVGLLLLMAMGMPIAFSFLTINLVAVYFLWGGTVGLEQLVLSIKESVASYTLMPVAMFILMGDVMFTSGIAPQFITAVDQWLGRLPGRLALVSVGAGTIFAALTGTNLASTAMLGSTLVPEMEKRGYHKSMSIGPILGSGGLAIMIPPTALGVLLAALAKISVTKLLIAIIIPGILMATMFAAYIIIRCLLQPNLAPAYELTEIPVSEKLKTAAKQLLPLSVIVFLVIGVIIMGWATPSEAAASGALGIFVLTAIYRKLSWNVIKQSMRNTVETTVMFLMIMTGAVAFGQILAFTGASRGLLHFALSLSVPSILILIAIQAVGLLMGMFIELMAIMMIVVPMAFPVVMGLGYDPVWFGVMFLINLVVGGTSPPFGMACFVMKGVAPAGTTLEEVFKAAMPYIYIQILEIALIMIFPQIALWLPSLMSK